jgi:hypothetical protein
MIYALKVRTDRLTAYAQTRSLALRGAGET